MPILESDSHCVAWWEHQKLGVLFLLLPRNWKLLISSFSFAISLLVIPSPSGADAFWRSCPPCNDSALSASHPDPWQKASSGHVTSLPLALTDWPRGRQLISADPGGLFLLGIWKFTGETPNWKSSVLNHVSDKSGKMLWTSVVQVPRAALFLRFWGFAYSSLSLAL